MEIEAIVYLMKKTIDDIISINYVTLFHANVVNDHRIEIDSFGRLHPGNRKNEIKIKEIKEKIKFGKFGDFLSLINDINNSYKHDIFLSETMSHLDKYRPTVVVLMKKDSTFNKMEYHTHDLGILIKSFSEFVHTTLQ